MSPVYSILLTQSRFCCLLLPPRLHNTLPAARNILNCGDKEVLSRQLEDAVQQEEYFILSPENFWSRIRSSCLFGSATWLSFAIVLSDFPSSLLLDTPIAKSTQFPTFRYRHCPLYHRLHPQLTLHRKIDEIATQGDTLHVSLTLPALAWQSCLRAYSSQYPGNTNIV